MLILASSADTKDTSLTLSKQTPALTDSMSYLGSSRECSPSYLGRCSISDSGSMSPDMHLLQVWSRQSKARIQGWNSPQQDSVFQFELHCQISTPNVHCVTASDLLQLWCRDDYRMLASMHAGLSDGQQFGGPRICGHCLRLHFGLFIRTLLTEYLSSHQHLAARHFIVRMEFFVHYVRWFVSQTGLYLLATTGA